VSVKKRGGQVMKERNGRVILRVLPLGYAIRFIRR
jgi:hypothetical protein